MNYCPHYMRGVHNIRKPPLSSKISETGVPSTITIQKPLYIFDEDLKNISPLDNDIEGLQLNLNRQVYGASLHRKYQSRNPPKQWVLKYVAFIEMISAKKSSCFKRVTDKYGFNLEYLQNNGCSIPFVKQNNGGFIEIAQNLGCYKVYASAGKTYIEPRWRVSREDCVFNDGFIDIEKELATLSAEDLSQLCMAIMPNRIACAQHNLSIANSFIRNAIQSLGKGDVIKCVSHLHNAACNIKVALDQKTNLEHITILKQRLKSSFLKDLIDIHESSDLSNIRDELERMKKLTSFLLSILYTHQRVGCSPHCSDKNVVTYKDEFIDSLPINHIISQDCEVLAEAFVNGKSTNDAWLIIYKWRNPPGRKPLPPNFTSHYFIEFAEKYLSYCSKRLSSLECSAPHNKPRR